MKYGDYLKQNRVAGWSAQYIDYVSLVNLIESQLGHIDENLFVKRVQEEEKRVDLFIGGKIAEIVNNLRFLESQADDELADHVAEELVKIDSYIQQNLSGFRKLLKKYHKKTGLSTVWYDSNQEKRWLHKASHVMHELIVQLSQYYARKLDASEKEWQPPSSFARKTTKYWVAADKITALKLFVIKHLPILELTKSSRVDHDFHLQTTDQSHNYNSSVYMDNDQLEIYHTRINKVEGATLFRVRWYGGEPLKSGETLPVPKAKQIVFVERKVHHESWTTESSTKDRFSLELPLLPRFLSGELPADKAFEIMVLSGSMSAKEAEELLPLAVETQRFFVEKKIYPVIRTVYHRTAFQRKSSNEVRISLDFPCYFVKETNKPKFWSDLHHKEPVEPFDYGVLEIKTAEEVPPPQWVEELLATGWLEPAGKFSKFMTSVVMYYGDKCQVVPPWIDEINLGKKDKDGRANGAALADSSAAGSAASNANPTNPKPVKNPPLPSTAAATASTTAATASTTAATTSTTAAPAPATTASINLASDTEDETAVEMGDNNMLLDERHAAPRRRIPFWPFNSRQNGSGFTSPDSSVSAGIRESRFGALEDSQGLRRRSSVAGAAGDEGKDKDKGKASSLSKKQIVQPMKVEPKTYFANERTFIQWLSAAILLSTLSTAVMSISPAARIAGTIFFPVSLLFMFYALFTYNWRLRKIMTRDGSRFDDPYGPWLLTVFLSIALVGVVTVYWAEPLSLSGSGSGSSSSSSSNSAAAASSGFTTPIFNPDSPFWASKIMAPPVAAPYAAMRYARGCVKTPQVLNNYTWQPNSWEIQDYLPDSGFTDAVTREWTMADFETRLSQFIPLSQVQLLMQWEKTEILMCLPAIDPSCDIHFWRYRVEAQEFILKVRWPDASFVPPQPGKNMSWSDKFEINAFCADAGLAYSFKIKNAPPLASFKTTDDINRLLAQPLYNATYAFVQGEIRYRMLYDYILPDVMGAQSEINVEVTYADPEQRSMAINGTFIKLQLRLGNGQFNGVSLSGLRQGDGMVEYLTQYTKQIPAASTAGQTVGIVLGCFVLVLLFAGGAMWYRTRRAVSKLP